MAERLGIVLYWAGYILGMAWITIIKLAIGGDFWSLPSSMGEFFLILVPALVLALIGWGLRYILAGY